MTQFSHLQGHYAQVWTEADYPDLVNYIVNTRTNRAFWIDDEIHELLKAQIIRSIEYKSKRELLSYFERNHVTLEPRCGSLEELGLGAGTLLKD